MKRFIIAFLSFVCILNGVHAQVKVGDNPTTINSSAVMELESTTKGFLPPRMTAAQRDAIASPATGLIVYCLDCNPAGPYYYDGTKWVSFGDANTPDAAFTSSTLVCTGALSGSYTQGIAMTGTNTKVVNIEVVSIGKYSATTNIVNGIKFENSGSLFSIGASVPVTLKAVGTPLASGTFTYTVTLAGQTCTFNVTFANPATFDCSNLDQGALSPADVFLTNGTSYSQTITVPYTAGNGSAISSWSTSSNGLTLTRSAGTYSAGGGNVTYTLSGTYTGTTGPGWVSFTTADGGCPLQVNGYQVSAAGNLPALTVQMDNLQVKLPSSGNNSMTIASVRKAATWVGGNESAYGGSWGGGALPTASIATTTSAFTYLASGASYVTTGDHQIVYLRDNSNNRWYKLNFFLGGFGVNSMLSIERLDVSVAGVRNGANLTINTPLTLGNIQTQVSNAGGNVGLSLATVSGTSTLPNYNGYVYGIASSNSISALSSGLSTTFSAPIFNSGTGTPQHIQFISGADAYHVTVVIGTSGGASNNLVLIEKLNATSVNSAGASGVGSGSPVTIDGHSIQMPVSGNRLIAVAVTSGTSNATNTGSLFIRPSPGVTANTNNTSTVGLTTSFTTFFGGFLANNEIQQQIFYSSATGRWYQAVIMPSSGYTFNMLYLKRY